MTFKMAVKELQEYRNSLAEIYTDVVMTTRFGFLGVGISSHAFGHLPQSKALHDAWKEACDNRMKDAKTLQDTLDYTVKALKRVEKDILEMDQENSWEISKSIRAGTGN